jgi:hypothetical protein
MVDYYSRRKRRFRAEQVPNYLRPPSEPRTVDQIIYSGKDIRCANPDCLSILQKDDEVVRRRTEDVETRNKRTTLFCSNVCEQDASVEVPGEEYRKCW